MKWLTPPVYKCDIIKTSCQRASLLSIHPEFNLWLITWWLIFESTWIHLNFGVEWVIQGCVRMLETSNQGNMGVPPANTAVRRKSGKFAIMFCHCMIICYVISWGFLSGDQHWNGNVVLLKFSLLDALLYFVIIMYYVISWGFLPED